MKIKLIIIKWKSEIIRKGVYTTKETNHLVHSDKIQEFITEVFDKSSNALSYKIKDIYIDSKYAKL